MSDQNLINEQTSDASLEDSAIDLIRKARKSFEHMSQTGYRFIALTDWLEFQVPVVSGRCREFVRAALTELADRAAPKDKN